MTEWVVLVTDKDEAIGEMEKMQAHKMGLLHRAFSILILNHNHEMLIHQRAANKYHSKGLWTNACCGHPRPGEDIYVAAQRRLMEEMGFSCNLEYIHSFTYQTILENSMIEHEVDHVFKGFYQGEITPNPDEVAAFKWMNIDSLKQEIKTQPHKFTYWFKEIMLHEFF